MPFNFDPNQNYYLFNNNNTTPLVFIHGVGLDQTMWNPQLNYFKNETTLTYDLLGHGKTPLRKNNLSMKNFTDQLYSLIKSLGINKFNLVGFSIGSLIAIEFASKYHNFLKSLTLIATTYKRNEVERQRVIDRVNLAKENKSISDLAMKRWFTEDYLTKNPNSIKNLKRQLEKQGDDHVNFIKAYSLFANYREDIKIINSIPTKTLVITGEMDPGSTPKMSRELCDDLAKATYAEIKNAKHLCSIECSDDVNFKIKKHIDNA